MERRKIKREGGEVRFSRYGLAGTLFPHEYVLFRINCIFFIPYSLILAGPQQPITERGQRDRERKKEKGIGEEGGNNEKKLTLICCVPPFLQVCYSSVSSYPFSPESVCSA